MTGQQFHFDGFDGRQVTGTLEPPSTTPRGWAIFAHYFPGGKDNLAADQISQRLARAGIGVLRFDYAGGGDGETSSEHPMFATIVGDVVGASRSMAAANMPPRFLVGHSLGGTAVLEAAGDLPEISAVATISAPADVEHILKRLTPEILERIETDGEAEMSIAGRRTLIRRSFLHDIFLHDIKGNDIEARVARLRRPLLVLHAPLDEAVGVEHASKLFLAAKHPKSFVSLDHADHLLTGAGDPDYAAAMIAAWASHHLPSQIPDVPQREVAQTGFRSRSDAESASSSPVNPYRSAASRAACHPMHWSRPGLHPAP